MNADLPQRPMDEAEDLGNMFGDEPRADNSADPQQPEDEEEEEEDDEGERDEEEDEDEEVCIRHSDWLP